MEISNTDLIKIAILDDHKIVREGIKAIFISENNYKLIIEAGTIEELQEKMSIETPDILLLDVNLNNQLGNDLIEDLLKKNEGLKILMLSSRYEKNIILDAVNKGAFGYLNKDTSKVELLKAINSIYDGVPYFGNNISHIIYQSYFDKISGKEEESKNISNREKEVILLIAEGLTTKEIADKLCISPRTVESHKKNIQEKFNVRTTIEILSYAIKHNIIQL